MLSRLSQRDRGLLLVGFAALATAGAVRATHRVNAAVHIRAEAFAHQHALLIRDRARVADYDVIVAAAARAKAVRTAAEASRVRATDATGARESAASYVAQVATASAVLLDHPPEVYVSPDTAAHILNVRAAGTMTFRGLIMFLHRLEQGPLAFTINELTVTQPVPDEHSQEELHVSLSATTYWLPAP
jgi:hypothetical protein